MKFTTIALALVAVMLGAVGVSTLQRKVPAAPVAPAATTPKAYKGPLPALPVADYPLPRPATVVKAVYEFAGRRPDVLHYIPCFCGCEQGGHIGNDDCFVKTRDAAGKPTAWEPHGMG